MLRLYKELPEFGGFLAFDTISGSLSTIDEKSLKNWKNKHQQGIVFMETRQLIRLFLGEHTFRLRGVVIYYVITVLSKLTHIKVILRCTLLID